MRGKPNPFVSSENIVLGLLYTNPTHGYDLHKLLTNPEGIGMIWRINMSNLYAQLDKLEKKGYITGTMQPGDSHPNRMEYHITTEGKTAFESWLDTPVKHPRDFRFEFMARYYFLLQFHPSKVNQLIQRQLEECKTWLLSITNKKQTKKDSSKFQKSVIEFRITQINTIIGWLDDIRS